VSLQRSLREGFGLAASEALWKRTPVVAGAAGGVPQQVVDGETGYLTESVDETAGRIVELVEDVALAIELGSAGRRRVHDRFLVTRLLHDELRLLQSVLGQGAATVGS
jgi:trehalose synthase